MHKLSLTDTSAERLTPESPETTVDDQANLNDTIASSNLAGVHPRMPKPSRAPLVALSIVALLAGVATGFGSYKLSARSGSLGGSSNEPIQQLPGNSIKAGDVFGSTAEVFKDSAEGYLEAGGIDGEGSHRLSRAGGESQTVFLTSSVTDLDKLVGMDVKVWGETFKAQKAGWLMDVGRIEVVNPEGTKPTEDE